MKNPFPDFQLRFPIRFKFMIAILLVVTSTLGVFTYTMARLFHKDKTAYIYDLTSVISLHTSEDAETAINSYREKMVIFTRLIEDETLKAERKTQMLNRLFDEYRDFLMLTVYDGSTERFVAYDSRILSAAGVTRDELDKQRGSLKLPFESIGKGELYLANTTLPGRLSTMTMATVVRAGAGEKLFIVSAVIRLDQLIELSGRSKVFETFLMDRDGVLLAHPDVGRVKSRQKPSGLPDSKSYSQAGSRGTTIEYTYGKIPMVGGFARLDKGGVTTVVQIRKATAYLAARELLNWLLVVVLLLLLASALFSIIWTQRLTRPIELLSKAANKVGGGDFDIKVDFDSRDEIGDLADSFNHMAVELKHRDSALQEAQAKLIQSEKMSAFGQLGAGIAHEVKNPLAGILGITQLSLRKAEKESPLHRNLLTIEKETKRCKTIIENLLKFARQEKAEFSEVDINIVLADATAIVDHQLGINQVGLDVQLSEGLPKIKGNANQLQQVFMNFMLNSQQAMAGNPGFIRLTSGLSADGSIEVSVIDNGPGIPKEIQEKIFEPFFTTKPAGQGTGLGLSVSYGIIKEHEGSIRLESETGHGTTFIVTFPSLPIAA